MLAIGPLPTTSFHRRSLTPFLKSFVLSLSLHVTVLGAMYLLPTATSDRFSSSGRSHVISIDMRLAAANIPEVSIPEVSLASVEPDVPILLDSLDDAMPIVDDELAARNVSSQSRRVTEFASALPDPPSAPFAIELPQQDERLRTTRRKHDAPEPLPRDEIALPRPRVEIAPQVPSAFSAPVEQMVGLDDQVAADFSNNQPPSYPAQAVRNKLEGTVTLRLTVSAIGDVERVEISQSSGHRILDQAAKAAVQKWKGKPAMRWGRPTATTEVLPIRFRL